MLRLRAPAKVNLYLEVVGKRTDGYHELRMLLAPVSLFDDLFVEAQPEAAGIRVECEGDPGVASGEANLCHRAAQHYFQQSRIRAGARIRLVKRIPAGAGLGGGSSDAAAVILGLEALFATPLTEEARRLAAFRVGADVPFFFARSAAWVRGIGEIVEPVPDLPTFHMVVVHPGVSLATAAVYSRFTMGLTSSHRPHTISCSDFQGLAADLRNDLQPAAVSLEPAVGQALEALSAAGACGAMMSGSGASAFGVFRDGAAAAEAAFNLSRQPRAHGWRIEVVSTLSPSSFPFL